MGGQFPDDEAGVMNARGHRDSDGDGIKGSADNCPERPETLMDLRTATAART